MKLFVFCMAAIVTLGLIALGGSSAPPSDQIAFALADTEAIGTAKPVEIKCLAPDVDDLAIPFDNFEKRSPGFNQKSEKLHIGFSFRSQEVGVYLDTGT